MKLAGHVVPLAARPGLSKAKAPPLVLERTVHLVRASDVRWSALLDTADIVSEGAAWEGDRGSYYGSTDIVLIVTPERIDDDRRDLVKLASLDPHLRLRALRIARREAAQRAGGPLDRVLAEISVLAHPRGVTLHIEIEARVRPDRRLVPRGESRVTVSDS